MIKKERIIIFLIVLLIIISGGVYLFLNRQAANSFSSSEQKWIEENKNQVIDISILNNLPYFGVNGKGVFFDFVNDLEEVTSLQFNKIPYNVGETPLASELAFEMKTNSVNDDLKFFTDSYVLIGEDVLFNLNELSSSKVGVISDDINLASYYLKDVELLSYENKNSLFDGYDEGKFDYMLISYLPNAVRILSNDYNVSYRFSDIANQYVLSANSEEEKLNSILSKYFDIWIKDNFLPSYSKAFVDFYFSNNEIDDQTRTTLLSKKYIYGYVNNLPYEDYKDDKFIGLNSQYLKTFSSLTNVEFEYVEYENISKLEEAFAASKVDLMFNYSNSDEIITSSDIYDNDMVIISHSDFSYLINSLNSLDEKTVVTVNNTVVKDYINLNSKAKIKTYDNMSKLISSVSKSDVIVLNKKIYEYYKASEFDDYIVLYEEKLKTNYNFAISSVEENQVFRDIFKYFVKTANKKAFYNTSYKELIRYNNESSFFNLIIKYFSYFSLGLIALFYIIYRLMRVKKVKTQIKKEDKLKFVDILTSLKNRNYLTYIMPKWDSNEVYPQTIIIVDLNQIQYINDNFGHEEGDKVIIQAANILINNQLENSDIVRTDGNEFLIYLVGYEEEDVISYIRKLNKELKNLEHGFGAALGYSVIKDGISTIDDAINEATLDMRTNKENIED